MIIPTSDKDLIKIVLQNIIGYNLIPRLLQHFTKKNGSLGFPDLFRVDIDLYPQTDICVVLLPGLTFILFIGFFFLSILNSKWIFFLSIDWHKIKPKENSNLFITKLAFDRVIP